jgi:hypothetical protein
MYSTTELVNYLDQEQSLQIETVCIVELNQNDHTNITNLGVYRSGEPEVTIDRWIENGSPQHYIEHDLITTQMRKTVTDDELLYRAKRPKSDYFSLSDCFTGLRPRSGILKLVAPFQKQQMYADDFTSVNRPRYYIPSINDEYKYWSSWNPIPGVNLGDPVRHIGLSESTPVVETGAHLAYPIRNAAPFVVYKEAVAVNKVTVKIQTGIGRIKNTLNAGRDPLSQPIRSTIPKSWRVQYLLANTWRDIYNFVDYDPEIIDAESGTIDLVYSIGGQALADYPHLNYIGSVPTIAHLPQYSVEGQAYCVGADTKVHGELYVYSEEEKWINYGIFQREWTVATSDMNPSLFTISDIIDPPFYNAAPDRNLYNSFNDFLMVEGMRIVVTSMLTPFRPFELIELSPRLVLNISRYIESYSIDRAISENNVLPVGEMSVSNGTVEISNIDLLLNTERVFDWEYGDGSLLAGRINKSTKFIFSELVHSVNKIRTPQLFNVPTKTLYSMSIPTGFSGADTITIELRDLIYFFEERNCPNIVLKKCSLTKAVAVLLDNIGFSNYMFRFQNGKYIDGLSTEDTIIPYFFVNEEMNVAEALQALSVATQCAMFFDEYNNFIVMPRTHFGQQEVYYLRGQSIFDEFRDIPEELEGTVFQQEFGTDYPNIETIDNASINIISDIDIKFTHRELARVPVQTFMTMNNPTVEEGEAGSFLGYKVSELWKSSDLEAPGLGAAPLNGYLSNSPPVYIPTGETDIRKIQDGTIDVGLWASRLPNFQGLLKIDSEIIRYDAKRYSIAGTEYWVTSAEHLEELRGTVGFKQTIANDQVGVATGLLRIWTDYVENSDGTFSELRHGRGMYGSAIEAHDAVPRYWYRAKAYTHKDTALDTIFSDNLKPTDFVYTRGDIGAGVATDSKITNYIYNSIHSQFAPAGMNPSDIYDPGKFFIDYNLKGLRATTALQKDKRIMRSSALTISGPPSFTNDSVTIRRQILNGDKFSVFGTRIGILGIQQGNSDGPTGLQTTLGANPIGSYNTTSEDKKTTTRRIYGSGGGLVFWTSRYNNKTPQSNDGYYFEISALDTRYEDEESELVNSTEPAPETSEGEETVKPADYVFPNINFYKINRGLKKGGGATPINIAVKLFSGYLDVRATTGSQQMRGRLFAQSAAVYDLTVEVKEYYTETGRPAKQQTFLRKFFLFVNGNLVGIAEDHFGKTAGYFPTAWGGKVEVGLFVRGAATVQFEHIFAIGSKENSYRNVVSMLTTSKELADRSPDFLIYSPSTIWNMIDLTSNNETSYRHYDEFGAIARECRKVTAKHSMFPTFSNRIAPTAFTDRAFSVSHFATSPYRSTMFISSQADSLLSLAENTTVTIQGLTFEDNKEQILRLDDYLTGNYDGANKLESYSDGIKKRNDLLAKRALKQTSKVEVASMYIQNRDYALRFMKWVSGFVGLERLSMDVKTFGTPHLQLGDIVTVKYDIPYTINNGILKKPDSTRLVRPEYVSEDVEFYNDKRRFIIRKITTTRTSSGLDMILGLVELPPRSLWNAGDFSAVH